MYALSRANMLGSSSATSTKVSSFLGDMILLSRRRRIRNQVGLTVKLCLGRTAVSSSSTRVRHAQLTRFRVAAALVVRRRARDRVAAPPTSDADARTQKAGGGAGHARILSWSSLK